jgi:hypothetical protein
MFISYKKRMVDTNLKNKGLNYETYSKKYNHKSGTVSKILMVLLIILNSFFFLMLNFGRNKSYFYFDHFIAATETICAHLCFMLILIIPSFVIEFTVKNPAYLLDRIDPALAILMISAWLIYSIFVFKKFYGNSILMSIIKALLFTGSFLLIIQLYRLITFWVSYWLAG